MTAHSLTQKRLKELLHYNPDTGVFTWLVSKGTARIGTVAGGINGNGYITIQLSKHRYQAHRLAFLYVEGAFPPHGVDHENHIRSDNRWRNLHHATQSDNMKNSTIRTDNTSGICGVHWNKRDKRWIVQISIPAGRMRGGSFKTKQEAISKRKALEKQYNFHENHGI